HFHADAFAVAGGELEAVAPEVGLSLEANLLLSVAGRLFNVDGDRQPDAGLHVHAPAVEVEVVAGIVFRLGPGVGAVEADNVAVLIFNPNATVEAAHAGNLGMHVEHPSADRSEEFAAHVAEYIVLLIEPGGIEEHHL